MTTPLDKEAVASGKMTSAEGVFFACLEKDWHHVNSLGDAASLLAKRIHIRRSSHDLSANQDGSRAWEPALEASGMFALRRSCFTYSEDARMVSRVSNSYNRDKASGGRCHHKVRTGLSNWSQIALPSSMSVDQNYSVGWVHVPDSSGRWPR